MQIFAQKIETALTAVLAGLGAGPALDSVPPENLFKAEVEQLEAGFQAVENLNEASLGVEIGPTIEPNTHPPGAAIIPSEQKTAGEIPIVHLIAAAGHFAANGEVPKEIPLAAIRTPLNTADGPQLSKTPSPMALSAFDPRPAFSGAMPTTAAGPLVSDHLPKPVSPDANPETKNVVPVPGPNTWPEVAALVPIADAAPTKAAPVAIPEEQIQRQPAKALASPPLPDRPFLSFDQANTQPRQTPQSLTPVGRITNETTLVGDATPLPKESKPQAINPIQADSQVKAAPIAPQSQGHTAPRVDAPLLDVTANKPPVLTTTSSQPTTQHVGDPPEINPQGGDKPTTPPNPVAITSDIDPKAAPENVPTSLPTTSGQIAQAAIAQDFDAPVAQTMPSFATATLSTPIALRGEGVASLSPPQILQVTVQVAQHISNGTTAFDIALHPAELGQVRMTLSLENGSATLTVTAERPESLDLLRRSADGLVADLAALGFSDISMAFSNQGQQEPSADKQPEQPADNPAYPQDPAANNPSANKVAGGLDLRL